MTATGTLRKPSMNEATEKDPFNNNSYGTLVDAPTSWSTCRCSTSSISTSASSAATRKATAEKELPADLSLARSLVPAGTATLRDFSNIAPEIPDYIPENCTGCMDCVTECPDTAILGKVLVRDRAGSEAADHPRGRPRRCSAPSGRKTKKYYDAGKKKGGAGGMFQIIIDPSSARAAPSASPSATTTPSR